MRKLDPRQILAGFLTFTMFVMLVNMVRRDHIDPVQMELSEEDELPLDDRVALQKTLIKPSLHEGPWKETGTGLKPCWTKPILGPTVKSTGFVTFSLTNGPEYHIHQIADAIVVARYLRATLVLPDIRGSNTGDKRSFGDIYDVKKLLKSLDGVVKVVKIHPSEISSRNLAVVKIPSGVTEEYISEHVEPLFRAKGNVRLATYFSVYVSRKTRQNEADPVVCLAMYGTLGLQPEVREVVDLMIGQLRSVSRKSGGRFIAVDLRSENCRTNDIENEKRCHSTHEIAVFLRKIGFDEDTTIYVSRSKSSNLRSLINLFPKVYTKESIMSVDTKAKFLDSESRLYEEVVDFFICSESDLFVPLDVSRMFYYNVVGNRIASGRTQILVPAKIPDSLSSISAEDFLSLFVSQKNHFTNLCFC